MCVLMMPARTEGVHTQAASLSTESRGVREQLRIKVRIGRTRNRQPNLIRNDRRRTWSCRTWATSAMVGSQPAGRSSSSTRVNRANPSFVRIWQMATGLKECPFWAELRLISWMDKFCRRRTMMRSRRGSALAIALSGVIARETLNSTGRNGWPLHKHEHHCTEYPSHSSEPAKAGSSP
jgi:hypothetical protein